MAEYKFDLSRVVKELPTHYGKIPDVLPGYVLVQVIWGEEVNPPKPSPLYRLVPNHPCRHFVIISPPGSSLKAGDEVAIPHPPKGATRYNFFSGPKNECFLIIKQKEIAAVLRTPEEMTKREEAASRYQKDLEDGAF